MWRSEGLVHDLIENYFTHSQIPGVAPAPRQIVFYAENHYKASSSTWREYVNLEKRKFEVTLTEHATVAELADHSLIPETQHEGTAYIDSSNSALKLDESDTDIPFDVRHLLCVPINPALSDILINLAIAWRHEILHMLITFVEKEFVRNLKQPSISFLNMIASLREMIDVTEYDYIRKKFHELVALVDERTRDVKARLTKIVDADGDLNVDAFEDIIEELMFKLPAKFTDLYLTGLIMANKTKSTMIICGKAHAINVKPMIDEFYKMDCPIIVAHEDGTKSGDF